MELQQQMLLNNNNNNNNNRKHLLMGEQLHQHLCAGCSLPIRDRYLLQALDSYWHEDCLKCSCCGCRLGEVGSNLFTKANLILCKRDYLRLFGATGSCSACSMSIPAFEMVMRAKSNVYHLDCFACQQCHQRFCVGDRFYLCENQILCEYDYEERAVFNSSAQNAMNGGSSFLVFAKEDKQGNQSDSPPGSSGQQQHHQQEQDASSSGYGSPDSSGGLIDEG